MTDELVCDKISVGDDRELRSVFIHGGHWVWDSPHSAHFYSSQSLVHRHSCATESNPVVTLQTQELHAGDSWVHRLAAQCMTSPLNLAKP